MHVSMVYKVRVFEAYELFSWILPCVIKRMEMNTHPAQFVRVPPLLTLSAKGEFSDIQKSARMLALGLLAAAVLLLLVFNASCYDFPVSSLQLHPVK